MVQKSLKNLKSLKDHKLVSLPLNGLSSLKGRIATAISVAFAFVIALAWNDAIKKGVDSLVTYLGLTGSSYIYAILVAMLVTIICIFGIFFTSKLGMKSDK